MNYIQLLVHPSIHFPPHLTLTLTSFETMPPVAVAKVNGTIVAESNLYEKVEDNVYVSRPTWYPPSLQYSLLLAILCYIPAGTLVSMLGIQSADLCDVL